MLGIRLWMLSLFHWKQKAEITTTRSSSTKSVVGLPMTAGVAEIHLSLELLLRASLNATTRVGKS